MGVSKNRGTPKWMVYNGKPYKNGWFGDTIIFGNTQIQTKYTPLQLNHLRHWDRKTKTPLSLLGFWGKFSAEPCFNFSVNLSRSENGHLKVAVNIFTIGRFLHLFALSMVQLWIVKTLSFQAVCGRMLKTRYVLIILEAFFEKWTYNENLYFTGCSLNPFPMLNVNIYRNGAASSPKSNPKLTRLDPFFSGPSTLCSNFG